MLPTQSLFVTQRNIDKIDFLMLCNAWLIDPHPLSLLKKLD